MIFCGSSITRSHGYQNRGTHTHTYTYTDSVAARVVIVPGCPSMMDGKPNVALTVMVDQKICE
jgi:hypothetical protein